MALDPLAPLKLGVRIGIGVVRFELRLLSHLLGRDEAEPVVVAEPQPRASTSRAAPPRPRARPPVVDVAPAPPVRGLKPEPAPHIDTEPELVGEFAEPGAEEGAGAEIRVEEPWEGFAKMNAADIRDRVRVAGPEELAVIQLFEMTHRRRRTVLDAVERRSRELTDAPAAP